MRNESSKELVLRPAQWETGTADISTRPIQQQPWTAEGPNGWQNGSWIWRSIERQNDPLPVLPGGVIQTWVGLLGPLEEKELRRRTVTKRLGTLITPFSIDGRSLSETIKL
jgi:hypothetical protein